MRTLTVAALALVATGLAACQPDKPLVEGWRPLTNLEIKELGEKRIAEEEFGPLKTSVSGDFNGDGKTDRVLFLVDEAKTRFDPYFIDGAGAPPEQLTRGDRADKLWRYTLFKIPHKLAYGMCMEDYRETFDRKRCAPFKAIAAPVVVLTEVDRGAQAFYWANGRSTEMRFSK